MSNKSISFYQEEKNKAQNQVKRLKKKLSNNALFRLMTFAGIFGFLFGILQANATIAFTLSGISLIVFLSLVRYQIILQKKKDYQQAREIICINEINACNHQFSAFRNGAQFENHRHNYSYDLDVFGEKSLFQMLNRTVTQSGEIKLAQHLSQETTTKDNILLFQESVKELAEMPELLIHFRASGTTSDFIEEDSSNIKNWLSKESFVSQNKLLNIIRKVLPTITLLSLSALIITGVGYSIFISLFLTNLISVGFYLKKINKEHDRVSRLLNLLKKYNILLYSFENENFKATLNNEIAMQLFNSTKNATTSLKELTKKVNSLDSRLNFVAAIFLQGLFLWDYQCLFSIEQWKKNYGDELTQWLEQIAQFDILVSMASFAYNNPDFNYPVPTTDTLFEAKNIGHPLLAGSVRISNDFSINSRGDFAIITGANMAGKSTFLRTIGVNTIIAMAGLPVCANSLKFKPVKLFTSMRTSDSLSENESYFYAELRRLKEMLDLLKNGEEMFIILDEILKGTNSVDKQKGSQLALEKILHLNGSGIIATHDLALTSIEKNYPNKIKNLCFEIEIDNSKINFDYKLYEGVTQKMNALLLMEQMGIV